MNWYSIGWFKYFRRSEQTERYSGTEKGSK